MMTFDDVFKQLAAIDKAAVSLLKEAGFHPDEGRLGSVRPFPDPAEDVFLRTLAGNLFHSLGLLHEELSYLRGPVRGEYRLEPFPGGRYGFFDKDGRMHSLSCGKTIEAKIHGLSGRQRWVRARIEHDGSGYYLQGHTGIPLAGLTVREREVHDDF